MGRASIGVGLALSAVVVAAMLGCDGEAPSKRGGRPRTERRASPSSRSSSEPRPAPTDAPTEAPTGRLLPWLALVETTKIEQIIGDFDLDRKLPTRSRTGERFGVLGTDLGQSFEHAGRAYFLFGDTLHPPGHGPGGADGIAWTDARSAEAGLPLTFVTGADGRYLRVRPDGQRMTGFEVPVAGIDLGGTAYLVCKIDHATESEGDGGGDDGARATDRSVVVRWDEAKGEFPILRTLSRLPEGRFLKVALVREGPWIYAFGSGRYRTSPVYLQRVRADDFASGRGTEYFADRGENGARWATSESQARPVVDHPTVGDVSVTRAGDLWLMTYDARDPRGVLLRWAHAPEGPWSAPLTLFDPTSPQASRFVRDPKIPSSPQGPVIGQGDPATRKGGAYAPYVIERFTRREGDALTLHYVLSTWNPYTVVLLRSVLRVEPAR